MKAGDWVQGIRRCSWLAGRRVGPKREKRSGAEQGSRRAGKGISSGPCNKMQPGAGGQPPPSLRKSPYCQGPYPS